MATENTTEQLGFIDKFFEAFNNQTPGIEIGFDVLTALALFFTFFGYLISSAKDRKQRRNGELDMVVDAVSHHLNETERLNTQLVLQKLDSKDINNALVYLSELENYLDYKLALSSENWINEASSIRLYQIIKDIKNEIVSKKKIYIDFLNNDKTNSIEFNAEQYELNSIVYKLRKILGLFINNDRKSFLEGMTTRNTGFYSFYKKLDLSTAYQVNKYIHFLADYFKSSGQIMFMFILVSIGGYTFLLLNDFNLSLLSAMWVKGALWSLILSLALIASRRKHKKINLSIKVVLFLYVVPFYFFNIDIIQIFKDLF